MVGYSASIKKPFLDIKNLLVGILLSIFPVVRWFAFGYALESSGLTKRKVPLDKSPDWSEWGSLFLKGLFATIISIIYFVPALIVFIIGAFSLIAGIISLVGWSVIVKGDSAVISSVISSNMDKIIPAALAALPLIIVAAVLALLAYYVLPSALMNFVYHNKFGRAFSFSEVFRRAFSGKYFLVWLFALAMALVFGLLLGWIPFVGSAAAYFIASVIAYTAFGQVYKEVK